MPLFVLLRDGYPLQGRKIALQGIDNCLCGQRTDALLDISFLRTIGNSNPYQFRQQIRVTLFPLSSMIEKGKRG
jgi:hypothetical protein